MAATGRLTQRLAALLNSLLALQTVARSGAIERLMSVLHGQVREQVKKSQVDNVIDSSRSKHL